MFPGLCQHTFGRLDPGGKIFFVYGPLSRLAIVCEKPTRKNVSSDQALDWLVRQITAENLYDLDGCQLVSGKLDGGNMNRDFVQPSSTGKRRVIDNRKSDFLNRLWSQDCTPGACIDESGHL